MPLNDFDEIYMINLERRRDKFLLTDFKLKRKNISYKLFKAIDGNSTQYDELYEKISVKSKLSRGALGLLLTYKKLLKESIEQGKNRILILEDDINFHKNFDQIFEEKKKLIFSSDLVYLGANQLSFPMDGDYELTEGFFTYGTYAISMTRYFAEILLDSLDELYCPIDNHIYHLAIKMNISNKIICPFLFLPDVTDSDTQGKRDMAHFCSLRRYEIDDYDTLLLEEIGTLKKVLNENRISLRQLFFPYRYQEKISFDIFPNQIQNTLVPFRKFFSEIFNWIDFLYIMEDFIPFVFIIPSYNNAENYKINLDSVFCQLYPKYLYRVIYLDDHSDDGTSILVPEYITENKCENQIKYYCQKKRMRQGLARFQMAHLAFPDEFLLMLDGDDWLFDDTVLNILDEHIYSNNLLVTYGSYYIYSEGEKLMDEPYSNDLLGVRDYPDEIIATKDYRNYDWVCEHLRGCYAFLFQSLKVIDLLDHEGRFPKISTDLNEMFSILEMAGSAHKNIRQVTMIYNKENSMKYQDTSFYHSKIHEENQIYRSVISRKVRTREIYPTIDKNQIKLKVLERETEIERWERICNAKYTESINPMIYNILDPTSNIVLFLCLDGLWLTRKLLKT